MASPRQKRPPKVDAASIERAALRYLELYDSTVANLRRVLKRRLDRAAKAGPIDRLAANSAIDALLARYESSGLLNDRRFAENQLSSMRSRGTSTRAARAKLLLKGVPQELLEDVLSAEPDDVSTTDPEFDAACAYVRKRRLGHYREPAKREERRQKDLAALARRGFSFDVARRALAAPDSE